MKKIILGLFLISSGSSFGQMPDSVQKYIDTAITIMQTRSLFSNTVNWARTRDTAFFIARDAKTYKQAFPALAYVFKQLKDYHGMAANEDTSYRYPPPVNFDSVLSKGIKAEFLKGNKIISRYYDKTGIGYLRIPSMNVFSQEDIDKKANALRDSLCGLLAKNIKGLIIDLRMNAGGNSAPMISGISPVLKDSILGYGVDRDNNFLAPAIIRNGVLLDENGVSLANVKNQCPVNSPVKMAVLIGPSTISSGEILAVYLKQQKNTRFFGEPSGHFCNATEGFLFMNNQGYLLLSVNKIADAKKRVYHKMYISPDKFISSKQDNFTDLFSDPAFNSAYDWLNRNK